MAMTPSVVRWSAPWHLAMRGPSAGHSRRVRSALKCAARQARAASHMAALHIEVLGGFSARTECGRSIAFAIRKAQALLAFLALAPGYPHARASLHGLLWGEREEEQARGSLRYALTDIRKGLGIGMI